MNLRYRLRAFFLLYFFSKVKWEFVCNDCVGGCLLSSGLHKQPCVGRGGRAISIEICTVDDESN